MATIKTHRSFFLASVALALVFAVLLLLHYTAGIDFPPKLGWPLTAIMAALALAQLMIIRDLKKKK